MELLMNEFWLCYRKERDEACPVPESLVQMKVKLLIGIDIVPDPWQENQVEEPLRHFLFQVGGEYPGRLQHNYYLSTLLITNRKRKYISNTQKISPY